jgi:hypothetical protein
MHSLLICRNQCKSISSGVYLVCGLALEIFDEVSQSQSVDSLDDRCDPGQMHIFQGRGGALEMSNKYSQIVFIDYSLSLLARWFDWSKWVAISSLPPVCSLNFNFISGVG